MLHKTTQELQSWLQDVITTQGSLQNKLQQARLRHGFDETDVIEHVGAVSIYIRLNIYASGYFMRLYECLAADFPVLKSFLGHDVFFAFAQAFLQSVPSTSYTLQDLGKNFVFYLKKTQPMTADPAFNSRVSLPIELARLECLRHEVIRAKGNEHVLLNTTNFESLFFRANEVSITTPESLRLAEFSFPLKRFMNENTGENLHLFPEPAQTFMAVSRKNYRLMLEEIPEWQYIFLQQSMKKTSLQQAIESTSRLTGSSVGKTMADLYVLLPLLFANNFIMIEE